MRPLNARANFAAEQVCKRRRLPRPFYERLESVSEANDAKRIHLKTI